MALLHLPGPKVVILVILSALSGSFTLADSTVQNATNSTVVATDSSPGSTSLSSSSVSVPPSTPSFISRNRPATTDATNTSSTSQPFSIGSPTPATSKRQKLRFTTATSREKTTTSTTLPSPILTAGRRSGSSSYVSVSRSSPATVATATAVSVSTNQSRRNLTLPSSSSNANKTGNSSGKCDLYRGGRTCAAIRSNQTVYEDPDPVYSQEKIGFILQELFAYLQTFVNPTQYSPACLALIEEGICRYAFPNCTESQSGQVIRALLCRANCVAIFQAHHPCEDSFVSVIGATVLYLGLKKIMPSQVNPYDFACPDSLPTEQSSNFTCMEAIPPSQLPTVTPPKSVPQTTCNQTVDGKNSCMFPFLYHGVTYQSCTNVNSFEDWNYWCYIHNKTMDQPTRVDCDCPSGTLNATCQRYSGGSYCSQYQSHKSIFVDSRYSQDFLGKALQQLGKDIDSSIQKSECEALVKKGVCNMLFPPCLSSASGTGVYPRLLCRKTCEQLRYGNCSDDFYQASSIMAKYLKTNHHNPLHVYAGELPCHRMPSATNSSKRCVDLSFAGGAISPPTTSSSSPGLKPVIVVVIVLGIILAIILAMATCWTLYRRQRRKLIKSYDIDNHASPTEGISLKEQLLRRGRAFPFFAENQYYKAHSVKEIPLERIEYVRTIGEGAFGRVFLGLTEELDSAGKKIQVAVKVLKEGSQGSVKDDFDQELEVMSQLSHTNIITLMGKYVTEEPYCMIFEYMVHGDLNQFLRMSQIGEQCDLLQPTDLEGEQIEHFPKQKHTLTVANLIYMCKQVCSALVYLSEKRFVHRDMATRNCLVGNSLVTKIADFGLSRDVYSADYYRVDGKALLPIRWMAPESILYGKFSTESDVWSFGVLLWEVFTLGKQPFYGMSNEEVVKHVTKGGILDTADSFCPVHVDRVMRSCWTSETQDRPTFKSLEEGLTELH